MTTKQKILRMVERLPEDVTYDRVIYHLDVMKSIEIGLEQIEKGQCLDHDELFEELLRDDEEGQDSLVRTGKGRPQGNKSVHRPKRPKGGRGVRKAPKRIRKKA